ncbi:MAG: subclass B3 metallo-beta-lactamase [Sphingomicrobium sp.]
MFASLVALALAAGPASIAEWQEQCAGKDGWSDPAPPIRIYANTYNVGTCGIVVLLVTSPEGHVMIDGATAEAVPGIAANVARLGFRMRDVKWLLNSHEHIDHAGGLAALKRLSGARLMARAPAVKSLATGKTDPADPQAGLIGDFEPVIVDRVIDNDDQLRLGKLKITSHATPGHTDGGTSWSWLSCAGYPCRRIVFADSVSAPSRNGYRFTDHPERVAPYRTTFARIAAVDCDILVTPHPAASNLIGRLARKSALDRGACAAYAARGRAGLEQRLASEAKK